MAASRWPFLAVPDDPEDAERSTQARLFNVVALAALAALGVAVVSQLFFGQTGIPLAMTFVALALTAALMAVARLGALRLARALLPPLMLAACIAVVLVRDGLHDNVMAAIGAVLVMGGVLLQRRALAVFTAAVILMIFAVAYAEIAGILHTRFSGFTDWRHAVGLALFLLFIAVTVRALMDSMIASLREAQHRRTALAGSYARLEAQTAALRESETRFAKAVETMAEGLVLLDMDGNVRLCNQAAERILGLPAAEIMRQALTIGGLGGAVRADGSPFPPSE